MEDESYYKFKQNYELGMISLAPNSSGIIFNSAKEVLIPALQSIGVWDFATGEKIQTFTDENNLSPITQVFCVSESMIAIGYQSGAIIFVNKIKSTEAQINNGTEVIRTEFRFKGHKKTVTAFCGDAKNSLLISGSKDTDIVVWDIFDGTGVRKMRGHTNEVCGLALKNTALFSCSKDGLVKVWDLETMTCVHSVPGHSGEIWSLSFDASNNCVITGSTDSKLRVWSVDSQNIESRPQYLGSLDCSNSARIVQTKMSTRFLYSACSDKKIDVFFRMGEKDIRKRKKRRIKRSVEKVKKDQQFKIEGDLKSDNKVPDEKTISTDMYKKVFTLTVKSKIVSLDAKSEGDQELLCATFRDNSAILYRVHYDKHKKEVSSVLAEKKVKTNGHRTAIRYVDSTRDGSMVMTATASELKFWSTETRRCIRTLKQNQITATLLASLRDSESQEPQRSPRENSAQSPKKQKTEKRPLPNNKHQRQSPRSICVVATKVGTLDFYDLESAEKVATVKAHTDAIWALDVAVGKSIPRKKTKGDEEKREIGGNEAINDEIGMAEPGSKGKTMLVSGSEDGLVKFWELDFSGGLENLVVVNVNILEIGESINCLKFLPKKNLIAIGLLDSTIKVHYADSLRFKLSLYGHKLPVLALDVSKSGSLLVSGSGDKNVKIWGLDFGDCHRSIFAHDNSVTAIKFLGNSHLFFSAGKDKLIKLWDAVKFENLMVLRGHCAEVWGLSFCPKTSQLFSVSSDMSIRSWVQTDEILFPEEEQEFELNRIFEENERKVWENDSIPTAIKGSNLDTGADTTKATLRTKESLDLAERLKNVVDSMSVEMEKEKIVFEIDIISLIDFDLDNKFSVKMRNRFESLLDSLNVSELEEAMLALPYDHSIKLLNFAFVFIATDTNSVVLEKALRFVLCITKLFEVQLALDIKMKRFLRKLKTVCLDKAKKWRDVLGSNVTTLFFLKSKLKNSKSDWSIGSGEADDQDLILDCFPGGQSFKDFNE